MISSFSLMKLGIQYIKLISHQYVWKKTGLETKGVPVPWFNSKTETSVAPLTSKALVEKQ